MGVGLDAVVQLDPRRFGQSLTGDDPHARNHEIGGQLAAILQPNTRHAAFAQQAMAATLAAARPGDLVLIHNYFRSHFGAGADTRSMQIDGQGRQVVDPAAKVDYYHQALDQLAARLAARGVQLVIVADMPRFMDLRLDPNLCVKQWFRPTLSKACDQRLVQTLAFHRSENAAMNRVLAAVAARHRNVQIFDPTTALCPDGLCRSHDLDGKLLYRDRDHLNELGVLMLDGDLRRLLQRD
jgi:hypothetical protein